MKLINLCRIMQKTQRFVWLDTYSIKTFAKFTLAKN